MIKHVSELVLTLTLLLTLSLPVSAQAVRVSGVDVPETLPVAGQDLKLNGAGARKKWFMDIYVGALYLPEPMEDPHAIIAADRPMAIRLHMVSGMITSDKMKDATMEGFDNATGGKLAPIQREIDRFIAVFDEEIEKGDVYEIAYDPGAGTVVHKNGEEQGTIGGGMAFKQAVFGIWLSDEPAHSGLKAGMLGRDR